MFLYVYVDLLSFYKPGTIDDILVGRVWTLDALLALVVRYAWSWPRHLEQPTDTMGARATPDPLSVSIRRPSSA